jgi:hypothetical protein
MEQWRTCLCDPSKIKRADGQSSSSWAVLQAMYIPALRLKAKGWLDPKSVRRPEKGHLKWASGSRRPRTRAKSPSAEMTTASSEHGGRGTPNLCPGVGRIESGRPSWWGWAGSFSHRSCSSKSGLTCAETGFLDPGVFCSSRRQDAGWPGKTSLKWAAGGPALFHCIWSCNLPAPPLSGDLLFADAPTSVHV